MKSQNLQREKFLNEVVHGEKGLINTLFEPMDSGPLERKVNDREYLKKKGKHLILEKMDAQIFKKV